MPTREALENLKSADERMKAAGEELGAFIEQPDRKFSPEGRAENRRLLDNVNRTIAEYWAALERAANT
jgi:hypothetical protein